MGEMIREYAARDFTTGLITSLIARTLHRYMNELGHIFFLADEHTHEEIIRGILSLKGIGRKRLDGIIEFAYRHKYIDWTLKDWRREV